MLNKLAKIETMIVEEDPDFILISESWTHSGVSSAEISFAGYTLFERLDRSDTKNGRGGGILLYCRAQTDYHKIDINLHNQVGGINIGGLEIYNVYRSPNSRIEDTKALIDFIETRKTDCLMIGDFNFPNICWETKRSTCTIEEELLEAMDVANLVQLIKEPTHVKGNTLDLTITNCQERIQTISVDKENRISDHFVLKIEFTNTAYKPPLTEDKIRDWKKADLHQMTEYFRDINWHDKFKNKNACQSWEVFRNVVQQIEDKCVPMTKCRKNNQPMWMNQNLLRIIRKKRRLYKSLEKRGDLSSLTAYRKQKNLAIFEANKARDEFEKELVRPRFASSRKFYSYMRSKSKVKERVTVLEDQNGEMVEEAEGKCELLNKFFSSVFTVDNDPITDTPAPGTKEVLSDVYFHPGIVERKIDGLKDGSAPGPDKLSTKMLKLMRPFLSYPLAVIYNRSMQEGKVPQDWKDANVCPIHKKGKKQEPGNYRPVSLTSIICKMMESVIKDELIDFLEKYSKLRPHQSGFRRNRSCVTNLLQYINKVGELVDQGHKVNSVYYDFSKAFDSVSHAKLIEKLETIGVTGHLKAWILNWLSQRRQRVVLDGKFSTWETVISGVPQGSVLGPVLFIIFINDIDEGLQNSVFTFADDLKLVSCVDDEHEVQSLQEDINILHNWSIKWKMKFNPKKCAIMHFGRNNVPEEYLLGDEHLSSSVMEKDLGILVQDNLKFDAQVKKVALKCNQILGQIYRSFKNKEPELMTKLYMTYVMPHMNYGVTVWNPQFQKDADTLERVQRRFTRMIDGMKGLEYHERCCLLGIPTLSDHRKKLDLIQTYRIIHGIDDFDTKLFTKTKDVSCRNTRQSAKENISGEKSRLEIRRKFFSQRVVNEWNKLPLDIQNARSLATFKSKLNSII